MRPVSISEIATASAADSERQLGAEADYAPALSLHEIAERTQLSPGQARYALKALERKGWIVMRGQRGSQRTTYQIRRE